MKKMHLSRLLAVSSLALTALFTSCDPEPLKDAVADFSVIVGLEPIATTASVLLVDAATGELLTEPVQASFGGENGNPAIDLFSDPLNQLEVRGGVINFGLQNQLVPNENNPVNVELNLQARGYLPIQKNLDFFATGKNVYTLEMIALNNPPSGVEVKNETLGNTDNTGALMNDASIVLNENGDGEVSLLIPKDNRFRTASGEALTGALSAQVVFFNPDSEEAMNTLPDNLVANANDSALTVLSAVNLTITDNQGREAALIEPGKGKSAASSNDGSYVLNFVLNGNTYSGLQQILRLAFFSPTTAERVILYSTPQINQLPNGRVSLRYALNSGFFRSAALVFFSEQPCDSRLTINRNGHTGNLPVRVTERGFFRSFDLPAGQSIAQLRNITRGRKTVRVTLPNGNEERSIDFCATTNPQITLSAPPPSLIDAFIKVNLNCVDPDKNVRVTDIPAASILYREENAPSGTAWQLVSELQFDFDEDQGVLRGASGKVNSVEVGKSYDFKLTYDNTVEESSTLITGAQIEVDRTVSGDFCR